MNQMNKEYKSLDDIIKMVNILAGFRLEQIKLIEDIAKKSYYCGYARSQQIVGRESEK